MNTLHNLQEQFSAAILGDDDSHVDTSCPFSVEDSIIPGELTSKRRLNIYRNNVNISLREALKAIYPVIHQLVGDDYFKLLTHEYIRQYPSLSGNLHDFGNHFSDFLNQCEQLRDLVYLPDVARLEWVYHSIFHSADSAPFDIDKLQKVSTEEYCNLVFKLTSASELLYSPYPVLRIWEINQKSDNEMESRDEDPPIVSLDEGENFLLIVRNDLDIEIHSLSPCEFEFLLAFKQKKKFFEACDTASSINPDCDVGKLIQKFILCGAIVDFEIASKISNYLTER